jgi:hypothetical protein
MRARTLWIATAALVGIALFYLERRVTRTDAADASSSPAPKPVQPEHTAAARSPQRPAPVPVMQASRPPVEPTAPVAIEDARPAKPQTRIEQFAPLHEALGRAFNAESSDGGWARNAQRTAEDALAARLPPQSAISSVTCRATMCRIESTHASDVHARTFVNQLADPESRPWNGAFYAGPVSQDPRSGVVTFVTYFGREGAAMPVIPGGAEDDATQ